MSELAFAVFTGILAAVWLVKWRVIIGGIAWILDYGDKFKKSNSGKTINGVSLLRWIRDNGGEANFPWGVMDCRLRLKILDRKRSRPSAGKALEATYAFLFRIPGLIFVTTIVCVVAVNFFSEAAFYLRCMVVSVSCLAIGASLLVIIESIIGFAILDRYASALHVIEKSPKVRNRQLIELRVFVLMLVSSMTAAAVGCSVCTHFFGSFDECEKVLQLNRLSLDLRWFTGFAYSVPMTFVNVVGGEIKPMNALGDLVALSAMVQSGSLVGMILNSVLGGKAEDEPLVDT